MNEKLSPWTLQICEFTQDVLQKLLFPVFANNHNKVKTTHLKFGPKPTRNPTNTNRILCGYCVFQISPRTCLQKTPQREDENRFMFLFRPGRILGTKGPHGAPRCLPRACSSDFDPIQGQLVQFVCNRDKQIKQKMFQEEVRDTRCASNDRHNPGVVAGLGEALEME